MGRNGSMSPYRLLTAAGVLAAGLTAAPIGALHSQTSQQDSTNHRMWGTMPGGKVPTGASTAQARTQATADSAFIREAAGNVLEVRLGTLAGQKASSPAVKQFAQRMVSDHTTMGNQWTALISRNGLPIKSNLDATQLQTVSQLGSLSGAAFDQAYMSTMVQDHQQDVSRFQSLGPSAQSADVRQLAASGLARMQQHLSMAQQVASQVGSPGTGRHQGAVSQAPTQPGQVVTQPAPPGQSRDAAGQGPG